MPLTLVSGRLSRHFLTLDRTVPPIPSESMEVSVPGAYTICLA
jgi:hypothetical protein